MRENISHLNMPEAQSERYYIFCPACRDVFKARYPDDERLWDSNAVHCMKIGVHTFNGDMERPTFSPSLLCTYDEGGTGRRFVCHSFIRDGVIQYLGDCTHAKAGQTVPLMDVPERFMDGQG